VPCVEKKQYELCREILDRFHKAGILDDVILIGSWCVYFYRDYFAGIPYIDHAALKTRDLDFLIDRPDRIRRAVNLPELLKDLGFIIDYKGSKGYIKLDHPDLFLEFLVPERGRGLDRPYPIPKLGINATALRFLNFLSGNIIRVKVADFHLTVPHPAAFALHKLIIFQRRTKKEKAVKDMNIALEVLKALVKKGEINIIKDVFSSIPGKWQAKIRAGLEKSRDKELAEALNL
jgi:hypothetical protein